VREIHPDFDSTFEYFNSVPKLTRQSLWNYMAYGLPPGGFVTAVLLNDFNRAMRSAAHSWSVLSFKQLASWIDYYMPAYMRGSGEAIDAWRAKTDVDRRDIMIELRLRPGEFEILAGKSAP
jgi:hypothetical protein